MKTTKKHLQEVPFFSSTFHAYLNENPALRPFYNRYPSIESAREQMSEKKFPQEKRQLLNEVLTDQYQGITTSPAVEKNIDLLNQPNSFTVVTGHQLNLFTGPLYVILKMITTINACEELKKAYPDKEFIPVYWMASEDHDFEEINHFNFNGDQYTWNTDQTGAVGRFSLKDMGPLLEQLSAFPPVFLNAYQSSGNLAEAVRKYINDLFGEYGLLVIDADESRLKATFAQVMQDDILQNDIQPVVARVSKQLDEAGFKTQVFAREINFFYLDDQLRTRIERDGDEFILVDSDKRFTRSEMEDLIGKHPEKLSPNVILRPLYEEMILPNLAYCGGPSELVYWLQLKGIFDAYDVPLPMLLPRNFAMIIPEHVEKKWEKTGCSLDELFQDKHGLLSHVALRDSNHEVKLNGQKQAIEDAFKKIQDQALRIDPTMGQHVEAQWARTERRLDIMEKKFIRAEKRHHEDALRQVEEVYDTLFPGGVLQERHDNINNFLQTDPDLISKMKSSLAPFEFSFNVMHHGK